ncbi:hypothetical protein WMY93_011071 [Mugilogobius chulae]|uniref:Integrin alpha-2 domain-containing protein n=1 Tax=Mugilogobius chulae TaxID=88201 RepID=A0AAW0PI27_9GOBI
MSLKLLAVVTLYHGALLCTGFNIDERFPVIKEGLTKGSFFGFSVALHRQTEGTAKYLLLAGAPKEKAWSLPNVNETGAVFSCPITTDSNDCTRMDLLTSTDSSELVEGMWLGATVTSQRDQPGRMLACGHRYVKIFRTGRDEHYRMVGKCFVRGNDLTFDPSDVWQSDDREVCDPNGDFENEGMCNMGISGGMTDTDVYLGATGSYMWQGNVYIIWRDPNPDEIWNSEQKKFGQFFKYRHSYIGYSVAMEKKLLALNEYTVVTGAPRDESRGSVLLAVTDLNNDDWNDLIVGAPFYFDRMKERGGAVYVYMNENGSFQKKPTLILTGPASSGFGFALAAIGDINQDGFQDFAVGAPFHETGQVYIWTEVNRGSRRTYTFGYSINGGIDMDENSYPDLLVGSLDDRIALLSITAIVCMSFTLSNGNKNFKRAINVNYTVEADMDTRKSARVTLKLSVVTPLRDKLEPVVSLSTFP